MKSIFKNKTILVTGGTGSIGSEIVRQMLRMKPKAIRVFARHEDRHHELMQELTAYADRVRFIVGDIRDKESLSLIKRQIAQNQRVTVTDPKMTRFLMTIPQAVSLLLDTAVKGKGQEIFVLKMPSVRLGDLIEEAIGYFAPLYGKKASEVRTAIVGKRDGEKLHEKLLAEHERGLALETKDLYILTPHRRVSALYRKIYKANPLRAGDKSFSSEYAPKLSRKALRALVSRAAK